MYHTNYHSTMLELLLITAAITLLSLVGVLVFGARGHLAGTRRFIVPFAIGTFLGVAFFELIPETLADSETGGALAITGGFLLFYVLAHYLHTYHHHHHDGETHHHCEASKASAVMLLIGDAVHNFVDGVVIASAYLVNPALGYVTALGIAVHEVPQEVAEYGVLRHAGYSSKKALTLNLASASTVMVGALATLALASLIESHLWILTGIAAGNLLYVAMSDLIPGLQASTRASGRFLGSLVATVLGILLIGSLITWSHEYFGHEHVEEHTEVDHVATNE